MTENLERHWTKYKEIITVITAISLARIAVGVKLLTWWLWLPCQLLQCCNVLFCGASPASTNRGWYWVHRVQLNSVPWVMGQTAEHGLKYRHSPLINSQRNWVSQYIFHHFYETVVHWSFNGHLQVRILVWKCGRQLNAILPFKCF